MNKKYGILIGTIGGGLWKSDDFSEGFNRVRKPNTIIPPECNVRAIKVAVDNSYIIIGTSSGLFLSYDKGGTWIEVNTPTKLQEIWSIEIDPNNSNNIFIGGRPDVFRSKDLGQNWSKLDVGLNNPCPIGIPRVTNIIVDPENSMNIWLGVEIDGIYYSRTGGESWKKFTSLGDTSSHNDIHGLVLGQNGSIYATSPLGIATTSTRKLNGSWDYHNFERLSKNDKRSYCRGLILKTDDFNTIFVGQGDNIPGNKGGIQNSTDGGKTWKLSELSHKSNSLIYCFATSKRFPDLIVAASIYGYIYITVDRGNYWTKQHQEFGEIRSIAIVDYLD
ncbi:hypothetical protein [Yeosuana marina]|uniref:WD40/YVTN/BNR-like repeat-containing protein n=1 Tax=Yeosuana marina TaxID=1565536 RepID=UPI0030C8B351